MDTKLAVHPIPERLKLKILLLIPNSLITIAQREGVGEYTLLLVIKMSMDLGFILFFSNKSVTAENITVAASSLLNERDFVMGSSLREGGMQVSWLNPDLARILTWKEMASGSNPSCMRCSRYRDMGTRRESGGR